MKKILKRGLLVLLALCTGYTVVASALLHGLGAYRVNTSFGQILAFSRQITLPVTVLLWVIALVADKRWLSRRRGTARGQSGPIPTAAPKSAPAHPTVPDASGPVSAEKIPPRLWLTLRPIPPPNCCQKRHRTPRRRRKSPPRLQLPQRPIPPPNCCQKRHRTPRRRRKSRPRLRLPLRLIPPPSCCPKRRRTLRRRRKKRPRFPPLARSAARW